MSSRHRFSYCGLRQTARFHILAAATSTFAACMHQIFASSDQFFKSAE